MKEEYEKPSVTADIVIFTVRNNKLQVLLVKRDIEPFKGKWALPGGFVKMNESVDETAMRELQEETGVKDVYLEQLYTFGDTDRDPRGRVITVAYMALVNSNDMNLKADTDVSDVNWFDIAHIPTLAFDHKEILNYALKRLRRKFEYTVIGFSMLPEKFTLSQVQKLYEIVFDRQFDKRNFVKKLHSIDILDEAGMMDKSAHRPAMTYTLKKGIPDVVEIL